jgi:L-ascorbate metabolism protein UlaG (beta-lactamase superfamily)
MTSIAVPGNPDLQRFYASFGHADGLFYMGHASVLGVFGGKKILFDPVVLSKPYGDSWSFFPPQVADPSVFDVDAVVISHIHQDHYDLQYLRALDGRAKTIVVGGRPSFLQDLRDNGIQNLHVVEPEQVTEIFDGVFMFGVTHETNGIDASALVFNQRFCIYHGNDNYLQPDSLKKFAAVGRGIDVACIPYAYIHWYPFLMECEPGQAAEMAAEGERLVKLYMDDCLNAIRILQPKVMIPFGANLLLNHGGAYSPINLSVKTPIEFCEYAARHAPDLAQVVKPMLAGDFCGLTNGVLSTTISNQYDGAGYREAANNFLMANSAANPDPEFPKVDLSGFLAGLNAKIAQIAEAQEHIIRIEAPHPAGALKLEIDCQARHAKWVETFTEGVPYHHFKLDAIACANWLSGKRFEEIIGMRRFTLKRVPNIYSKSILRLTSTAF